MAKIKIVVTVISARLQEMQQMDIYHYTRGLGTEYLHDLYPQTIWVLGDSSKRALGFLFPASDGFPLAVHFVAAAFPVSEVTLPRWT